MTTGFYARIRHPIYAFGTMAFLLVLLALQGWQALVIWAILIPVQVIRARREERVLTEAFGAEYEAYRKSTRFEGRLTAQTHWRRGYLTASGSPTERK